MLQDAQPLIHYAPAGRATACGQSTDDAIHTEEVELVANCHECIAAAAAPLACPGGCGDALACSCYLDGYNAGLAAALATLPDVAARSPGNPPAAPAPAGQPPRQRAELLQERQKSGAAPESREGGAE